MKQIRIMSLIRRAQRLLRRFSLILGVSICFALLTHPASACEEIFNTSPIYKSFQKLRHLYRSEASLPGSFHEALFRVATGEVKTESSQKTLSAWLEFERFMDIPRRSWDQSRWHSMHVLMGHNHEQSVMVASEKNQERESRTLSIFENSISNQYMNLLRESGFDRWKMPHFLNRMLLRLRTQWLFSLQRQMPARFAEWLRPRPVNKSAIGAVQAWNYLWPRASSSQLKEASQGLVRIYDKDALDSLLLQKLPSFTHSDPYFSVILPGQYAYVAGDLQYLGRVTRFHKKGFVELVSPRSEESKKLLVHRDLLSSVEFISAEEMGSVRSLNDSNNHSGLFFLPIARVRGAFRYQDQVILKAMSKVSFNEFKYHYEESFGRRVEVYTKDPRFLEAFRSYKKGRFYAMNHESLEDFLGLW